MKYEIRTADPITNIHMTSRRSLDGHHNWICLTFKATMPTFTICGHYAGQIPHHWWHRTFDGTMFIFPVRTNVIAADFYVTMA